MIKIKRLLNHEVELFKDLRLSALKDSPFAFSASYEKSLTRNLESWKNQVKLSASGADKVTFIAFSGNKAIGRSSLYRHGDTVKSGELLQVWVDPSYRGQGVASNILLTIIEWAKDNDFDRIIATIGFENREVIPFYKRYGFTNENLQSADDSDEITLILGC